MDNLVLILLGVIIGFASIFVAKYVIFEPKER
jgi:hypothetical protein